MFRFTLYWTLVLYVPSFVFCGVYAFINLSFPPRRSHHRGYRTRPGISSAGPSFRSTESENIPLRRYDRQLGAGGQSQLRLPSRAPAKQNETRSRLTFAVLVFMLFATFALGGAVVGSAIVGYVLAGLYKAGKYHMSTCVSLVCAPLSSLRDTATMEFVDPCSPSALRLRLIEVVHLTSLMDASCIFHVVSEPSLSSMIHQW